MNSNLVFYPLMEYSDGIGMWVVEWTNGGEPFKKAFPSNFKGKEAARSFMDQLEVSMEVAS